MKIQSINILLPSFSTLEHVPKTNIAPICSEDLGNFFYNYPNIPSQVFEQKTWNKHLTE